ncbi:MAG TPA: hypothetical protein VE309_01155 [Caulobacteraceae bacterium]|jgi:hypothetical protein|nr:hypothetical protein [Caulobacteraceae bacterium]
MTLGDVLQLYAPLAGLLVLAFLMGAQHQRIAQLGRLTEELRAADAGGAGDSLIDRLARLETNSDNQSKSLEKIDRQMEGVQRQLTNLTRGGKVSPADVAAA